ncbi:breast carcinoma-amplified sequence 4 [Colius striatus]|uniref:breast carcinoma-amplified sequence 4 n=1 Tax=Colius striatus TaxID=57412 RepID=UPI002B1E7156|nr:breast carcinoma-amplified sequence 4 [Colius striatus]
MLILNMLLPEWLQACEDDCVQTCQEMSGDGQYCSVKEMEETTEELSARPDEFRGVTDAIRSDTSGILDETIPLIKDKVTEMNHIYAKVDKLEAFVKMVAQYVSFLEEQVLEAEKSHGTFLNTVCKLFQCATISSFKNRQPLSAARPYNLPKLYRTEDFFPMSYDFQYPPKRSVYPVRKQ